MKLLRFSADYMCSPFCLLKKARGNCETTQLLEYVTLDVLSGTNPYLETNSSFFDLSQYGELPDSMPKITTQNFPKELADRIQKWDAEFQATLSDYPPDSKFSTKEEEKRHYKQGLKIAKELASFFKGEYEVYYGELKIS